MPTRYSKEEILDIRNSLAAYDCDITGWKTRGMVNYLRQCDEIKKKEEEENPISKLQLIKCHIMYKFGLFLLKITS